MFLRTESRRQSWWASLSNVNGEMRIDGSPYNKRDIIYKRLDRGPVSGSRMTYRDENDGETLVKTSLLF